MKEEEILELKEIVSEIPEKNKEKDAIIVEQTKEDIPVVNLDAKSSSQDIQDITKEGGRSLISESVANNSAKIIKNLLAQKKPTVSKDSNLEDLVIECMKPFLSQWLEKNLESIVEKVVREQIKTLLPNE